MSDAQTTFDDVQRAAACLREVANRTPVLTSRQWDARTGTQTFFKMESFQRGGAFKFRGAYSAVFALSGAERGRGVITYSSGNHASALALACQLQDTRLTVLMPSDAPRSKISATRTYGAEIVMYDRYDDDRDAIVARMISEQGLTFVPPFDDRHVIAGQGTAAMELFAEVGSLDCLYVPVGGGGLIAGSALSANAVSPDCKVIGVEPEAGDDACRSFELGEIVKIAPPRTIADGAQTTSLGRQNFQIMRRYVARITTASDEMLKEQMAFFMQRMKVVVEPTGCLGAAAALREANLGKRVGVIVSGGNVDLSALSVLVG